MLSFNLTIFELVTRMNRNATTTNLKATAKPAAAAICLFQTTTKKRK
jgi:hypothetical protein